MAAIREAFGRSQVERYEVEGWDFREQRIRAFHLYYDAKEAGDSIVFVEPFGLLFAETVWHMGYDMGFSEGEGKDDSGEAEVLLMEHDGRRGS